MVRAVNKDQIDKMLDQVPMTQDLLRVAGRQVSRDKYREVMAAVFKKGTHQRQSRAQGQQPAVKSYLRLR